MSVLTTQPMPDPDVVPSPGPRPTTEPTTDPAVEPTPSPDSPGIPTDPANPATGSARP